MGVNLRYALTTLLGAVTIFVLAACGGDAVALDPVAEAASTTAQVESMRIALTTSMTLPETGNQPVTVRANGIVDGKRSAMIMRLSALPGAGEVGEIEVRLDGTTMYMRMPFLQRQAPELKPWIEIDLTQIGKESGIDLEALLELGRQNDPTQPLDILQHARDAKKVGTETVRGVETTRYRGTVDYARYAAQLDKDGNKAAAAALRKLIDLGVKTTPLELWVDEDSYVRRLAYKQAVPVPGAEPAETSVRMELYDFGADVNVQVPPVSETMTFAELLQRPEGA